MDRLYDTFRQRAGAMDAQIGTGRFALVQSYDPNTGTAKVLLQPEGKLTGWLPVLTQWVGAGWGIHAPLQQGDQVFVVAQEGHSDHGVIVGRAHSAQALPPQGVSSQELLMRHSSGAFIRMGTDGKITLQDPSGTKLELENNGKVKITGDLLVTGNITDLNNAHGSLDLLRQAYNQHRHGGSPTTDHPV